MRKEIVLLFLLASCSQFSKKNCLEKNWFEQGKRDQTNNLNVDELFSSYKKSCSAHDVDISKRKYYSGVKKSALIQCTEVDPGVSNIWFEAGKKMALDGKSYNHRIHIRKNCQNVEKLDHKEFKRGYSLGLKLLCTEVGGYKFGVSGKKYKNTCNKRSEKAFNKGYKIGNTEHRIKLLDHEIKEVTNSAKRKRIEYKELKSEFKDVEYELINFDWKNRQNIKELNSDIKELESAVHEARETNDSTEKIVKYNLKISKLKEELKSEQAKIINDRKDKRRRYNFLRHRLKRLNTEIKSLKIQINLLESSKKRMEKDLS